MSFLQYSNGAPINIDGVTSEELLRIFPKPEDANWDQASPEQKEILRETAEKYDLTVGVVTAIIRLKIKKLNDLRLLDRSELVSSFINFMFLCWKIFNKLQFCYTEYLKEFFCSEINKTPHIPDDMHNWFAVMVNIFIFSYSHLMLSIIILF